MIRALRYVSMCRVLNHASSDRDGYVWGNKQRPRINLFLLRAKRQRVSRGRPNHGLVCAGVLIFEHWSLQKKNEDTNALILQTQKETYKHINCRKSIECAGTTNVCVFE